MADLNLSLAEKTCLLHDVDVSLCYKNLFAFFPMFLFKVLRILQLG